MTNITRTLNRLIPTTLIFVLFTGDVLKQTICKDGIALDVGLIVAINSSLLYSVIKLYCGLKLDQSEDNGKKISALEPSVVLMILTLALGSIAFIGPLEKDQLNEIQYLEEIDPPQVQMMPAPGERLDEEHNIKNASAAKPAKVVDTKATEEVRTTHHHREESGNVVSAYDSLDNKKT